MRSHSFGASLANDRHCHESSVSVLPIFMFEQCREDREHDRNQNFSSYITISKNFTLIHIPIAMASLSRASSPTSELVISTSSSPVPESQLESSSMSTMRFKMMGTKVSTNFGIFLVIPGLLSANVTRNSIPSCLVAVESSETQQKKQNLIYHPREKGLLLW